MKKENIIQSIKVIALGLMVAVGLSYAFAWTAPSLPPPEGNVPAPVNVGVDNQTKEGNMSFLSSIDAVDAYLGNVGIRNTNPQRDLHIGNGTGEAWIKLTSNNLDTKSGIEFDDDLIPDSQLWKLERFSSDDTMRFTKMGKGNHMVIKPTGEVGIGTIDPEEKLSVVGNIEASGTVCDGTGACIGGGNVTPGTAIYKCPIFKTDCAAGQIGGLPKSTTPCEGQLTDSSTCKYKQLDSSSDCFGGGGNVTVTKDCVPLGNLIQ